MLFSVRNGLKEDALVDIPNTLTMQQLILMSSLFTLLISWLVVFAYLALRPTPEKYAEPTERAAMLPVTSPVIQTIPLTPRASGIHTITQQTPIVAISADSTREIALDRSGH